MSNTKLRDPIAVCGPWRSGTSMMMGLIHLGGAWVGECKDGQKQNPLGFFENDKLFCAVSSLGKHPNRNVFREAVRRVLKDQKYEGGPWVVKIFPEFFDMWASAFDPFWVFMDRDQDCILASRATRGKVAESLEKKKAIRERNLRIYEVMEKAKKMTKRFCVVDPEKIVNRNYEDLVDVYEKNDLHFYGALIDHFVVPNHWHHRSGGNDGC